MELMEDIQCPRKEGTDRGKHILMPSIMTFSMTIAYGSKPGGDHAFWRQRIEYIFGRGTSHQLSSTGRKKRGPLLCHKKVSLEGSAQKTSIPPPMTPKRTAHPVVRTPAERPAVPPVLPEVPEVLVGEEVEPEGLLLVREDKCDATLEALDLTEDKLEVMEERTEEAVKTKSTGKTQKERKGLQPHS